MTLTERKAEALREYQEAKARYMATMASEDWKTFCDAKRVCMQLGVRI